MNKAQPRVARSVNDYAPPSYTPINSWIAPKNTTTPAINTTTHEPTLRCPTGYVFTSIRTVDVTVTVTASSNGSYHTTEVCKDCTQTVTISNTVLVPPTKYASTLPYGEENTRSPYRPVNSTYAAPSPAKTGNDYSYMNSTLGYSFSTPVDQRASPTAYQPPRQSVVYSTPGGQMSPPVFTKPVHSDPTYGNSTGTSSGYVPPVYTKPAYSSVASGNATVPVRTKPAQSPPVYSAPVYTTPVLPAKTSAVTPPIYTKVAETPVYSVPVYTKAAYHDPVISRNSSTVELRVVSSTTQDAVYTPPVYNPPVVSSESSEYSAVSILTNSTTPPMIPPTSEDRIIALPTDTTTSSETETPSAETTSSTIISSQAPPRIPTPSTTDDYTSTIETTETTETTIAETSIESLTISPTVTPFQPARENFSYEQPR